MRETWVQSLGWEDPLEKEMATHSSILAWEMPRTEEIPKTTLKCVCVCVCVCVCLYLLLPSWSLSRNLHVFLPLYLLTASRRRVRLAPASPRRRSEERRV